MQTFEERLAEVNATLQLCHIRQKGTRLYVRGTFPPKPGDGDRPKQYEISTGKPATFAGLRQVQAIAHEVESLLIREKFHWEPFLRGKQKPHETVKDWVDRLTEHHWQTTPKDASKLNSWHKDYELKFCHLPENSPLTLDLLKRVILERSQPGTRSRTGYAMAFRVLAEFAGLPGAADLGQMGKGYSASRSVNARELPGDDAIATARQKFLKRGWVWVFDALVIYGLRPHEVFRVLVDRLGEDPPLLEVPEKTKTGFRLAFPIGPDGWQMSDYQLPKVRIEGRNNNQLGLAISQKFRQLKLGFSAYDLRHSYARRGFEYGFPPDFLAKSMGHSLEVHLKLYRAWWGEQPYLKMYREVMNRRAPVDRGGC